MNRFVFGLQRLLDIRGREEERLLQRQIRLELALREERHLLSRLDDERVSHCKTLDTLKCDAVAINEVLHLGRFIVDLDERIVRQRHRIVDAEQAICEARAELTQARLERKALEKLRDKKHAAWQQEALRADARLMDEIATTAQRGR